jgi:hypothetical protein
MIRGQEFTSEASDSRKPTQRYRRMLHRIALPLLVMSACLLAGGGHAQVVAVRDFPEGALRGRLEITQPPDALLDGRPTRLAPGARIRSASNLLVTPASLVGERHKINYLSDAEGQLQHVWLLTDAEAALSRPPGSGGGILSWFGF